MEFRGHLPFYSITKPLSDLNLSVDWERVWSNLSLTSKNLAHRLIHFKVIHRAYITPYKRFKMKLQSNFNCRICNTASSGTFLHMIWECPIVISLWTHVTWFCHHYCKLIGLFKPSLCLLNDDSGLCISSMQKRMLFAGFTAAKKTIIQNWFTPHMCGKTYWIRSLLFSLFFQTATNGSLLSLQNAINPLNQSQRTIPRTVKNTIMAAL